MPHAPSSRPRRPLAWAAPFVVAAACADAPTTPALAPRDAPSANATADYAQTLGFRRAVTVDRVRAHQAALQAIADANGGTRVAGTAGGDASEAYVHARLAAAGYAPSYQSFSFTFTGDRTPPVLQRISPPAATYAPGVDFATMTGSGSGDVTAPVYAVQLDFTPPIDPSMIGCAAGDFAGFPPGAIALLQRNGCTFALMAQNAQAAGAAGVIIFNEGNTPDRLGVVTGTLGPAPGVTIPVVGATFALGQSFALPVTNGPTGVVARLRVDFVSSETRTGRNVIAEAPGGDPARVIVVASAVDGDARGPAINATSGAAAALAIAEAYAGQDRTSTNRVRFVFFSGYAEGNLGTTHYLNALAPSDRARIAAVVGSEVLGSPNFGRFVLDATTAPAGSAAIRDLLTEYFGQAGLASRTLSPPTGSFGGSVLTPFALAGIPAGGLYAGTIEPKTAEQAALFGGTAGIAFDPCYRLACDTFANVSPSGLDQMTDATAHAVLLLSRRNLLKEPLAAP
ncbi:M28 family peptidase [Roseisolibacter sp. H3M3-2]|uniref:M28 family peptidase n=1 Tax=Roseisolibacter sp. H3M3-2 TaxID=3031323 RepID=UPI0023DAD685|nr:M28 family peptidase [Roseisolibacter sp. H3M3-2]MDF1501705.1 M28 family peptidase [Roseisolibacter sp. H3M3-2]